MANKDYNKMAFEYGISPKGAEALDKRLTALEQGKSTSAGTNAKPDAPKTQNF